MEQDAGEVRVMTVHGAKGLEANIVILPDTCFTPDARTESNPLIAADAAGNVLPLWRLSGRVEPEALARLRANERARVMEEYRRQLYVAMTRARDELHVCGYTMLDTPNSGCWYELVKRGLLAHPMVETTSDGLVRIAGNGDGLAEDKAKTDRRDAAPEPMPPWARAAAASPSPAPAWRAPSRLVRPGMDGRAALRGRAMHKLFQVLPDLAQDDRQVVARRILARHGIEPGEIEEIAEAALALITAPEFAPFFARSSMAEVPFVARLSGPIGPVSGQIDRLIVTEEAVLILDFKTDRRPPSSPDEVSAAYVAQLAAYRLALAPMFPGKPIRTALLWTELPALMELPADMLDLAFSAYHGSVRRP
jgi:ATP-dependent helicase/nuclease subunit A